MADSVEGMEQEAAEREVQYLFEKIVPRVAAAAKIPTDVSADPGAAMGVVVFSYKVALAAVAIRPQMMSMLPEFVKIAKERRESTG